MIVYALTVNVFENPFYAMFMGNWGVIPMCGFVSEPILSGCELFTVDVSTQSGELFPVVVLGCVGH